MAVFPLTRRRLLISAAGAAAVVGGAGLWLGVGRLAGERFHNAVDRGGAFAPSVYLAVLPDGEVVIWLTRSEMGQGVSTALPMLVADELDADWSRVRVEQAVAGDGFDYGQLFTAASASVSSLWVELRRAGASARELLVGAAAARWDVDDSDCVTQQGRVLHPASGRQLEYGALTAAAAGRWPSLRPRLKSPQQYRLIGRDVPRLDIPDKVRGTAIYGLDVRRPGMLRAVIARSPVAGGNAVAWDDAAALAVPGVREVGAISSGVAVVAETTHAAIQGRQRLTVRWQHPPEHECSHQQVAARLRDAVATHQGQVALEVGGRTPPAAGSSGREISAVYQLPYAAHVCMEPMNCTAQVQDGGCQVWVPTQAPDAARSAAAEAAGVPLERVRVHTTLLGGGFGRRSAQDFVREAVELASRIAAPVQVIWTREDDLQNGEYRDASAHQLQAVLGPDGGPILWEHRIAATVHGAQDPARLNPGSVLGAVDMPYEIERRRVLWQGVPGPLPIRIWRSVGHAHNGFAVESFVDELAEVAGADAIDYRRRLLGQHPRLVRCLDRVAAMSGWPGGGSRFLGVAASHAMGSYLAQVVEVSVSDHGTPQLERAWCAVDCGAVVNPDTVRAQVAGGMLFGFDAALYAEIRLREGAVADDNFHRHRLLRIAESPDIEVQVLAGIGPPRGVGEIGVPGAAPALANAWYRATGRRIRDLPLSSTVAPTG